MLRRSCWPQIRMGQKDKILISDHYCNVIFNLFKMVLCLFFDCNSCTFTSLAMFFWNDKDIMVSHQTFYQRAFNQCLWMGMETKVKSLASNSTSGQCDTIYTNGSLMQAGRGWFCTRLPLHTAMSCGRGWLSICGYIKRAKRQDQKKMAAFYCPSRSFGISTRSLHIRVLTKWAADG